MLVNTHYFNQANGHERQGRCEQCQQLGVLKSYDCVQYLTFFHTVPILPLARKRVIDHCSSCDTHSLCSLREYLKTRTQVVKQCQDTLRNEYAEQDAVTENVIKLANLDPFGEFSQVVSKLEQRQDPSAELQSALKAAKTYLERQSFKPLKPGLPFWLPLALPIILTLAVLTAKALLWSGGLREVHLVNGTHSAYSVEINGKTYELKGQQRSVIQLSEGPVVTQIKGPSFHGAVRRSRFDLSLSDRLFHTHCFVINPDGLALLKKELWVTESQRVRPASEGMEDEEIIKSKARASEFLVGRFFYHFRDVSYIFEGIPQLELSLPNDSLKTRLTICRQAPRTHVQRLVQRLKGEALKEALRRLIHLDTSNRAALRTLSSVYGNDKIDDFLQLLKTGLDAKPTRVEWHRVYQDLVMLTHARPKLFEEYQRRIEKDPKNPYLHYLLGRIHWNSGLARTEFLNAESCGQPIGYGYHGLSFSYLSAGDFEQALEYAQRALKIRPRDALVLNQLQNCRIALKDFKGLLRDVQCRRGGQLKSRQLVIDEILLLATLGEKRAADQLCLGYLSSLKNTVPLSQYQALSQYLNAAIAYSLGDYRRYAQVIKRTQFQGRELVAAALEGRLDDMAKYLKNPKRQSPEHFLLLYCMARHENRLEMADVAYRYALALLSNRGDPRIQAVVKMLAGDKAVIECLLPQLPIASSQKRLFACALGMRHPEMQEHCFDIARTHNFQRVFPYSIIKDLCR